MITNLKIQEIVISIVERWKLIAIVTMTVTLISAITTFFLIDPQYEASTKLFIGKDEKTSKVKSYDNNEVIMYQKLLKTYSEIIKTEDLANLAIKDANVDIKEDEFLRNLTVVPIADTQILEIKLKNESRKDLSKLATSITKEFIDLSKELVPNGNIQILEDVQVSNNPISPNKKMNIIISILIGLIGGVGITVLLEAMDNTFKSKDTMERELELAVIGVIPNIDED